MASKKVIQRITDDLDAYFTQTQRKTDAELLVCLDCDNEEGECLYCSYIDRCCRLVKARGRQGVN